jgi:hypothetical protein
MEEFEIFIGARVSNETYEAAGAMLLVAKMMGVDADDLFKYGLAPSEIDNQDESDLAKINRLLSVE